MFMIKNVLVTGGAGYIGSHTVLELLREDFDVVVIDNLSNSSEVSLKRTQNITGKKLKFHNVDITDKQALREVFGEYKFDAVIHFAALKAVGESVQKPHLYFYNNFYGTLCLLEVMEEFDVVNLIFSSSATVYGEDAAIPYIENMDLGNPISPYGASKVMVERVLNDTCKANNNFRSVSLRYFNPLGAHASGKIGEDPHGIPNNLLPFILQVAVGKRKELSIFGDDYPTIDGTCRRDYIHVVDVAKGHLAALTWLSKCHDFKGGEIFNLGAGHPVSVLEVVQKFTSETGIEIPYVFAPKRFGDLPEFWADVEKAEKILGWKANLQLDEMIRDAWNWQSNNPNGYSS